MSGTHPAEFGIGPVLMQRSRCGRRHISIGSGCDQYRVTCMVGCRPVEYGCSEECLSKPTFCRRLSAERGPVNPAS